MTPNPYPTRPGFGLRVHIAAKKLRDYGFTYDEEALYTRGFDTCFEMHDGDAVVWALMHKAHSGDVLLERGIKLTGMWMHWLATYRKQSAAQPDLLTCNAPATL